MNQIEKKMVGVLKELRAKYNLTMVKAEFEAEGTRMEEAMRLKEVSMMAGLGLAIKVGGCEAIKDMFEASSLGVSAIIAPMVETRYALKKFLGAIDIAFTSEQQEDVEFFINIETITSCRQFDDMLTLPNLAKLDGVVIGRVDLTGSLDLDRSAVDGAEILALATEVAAKAKGHGLKVIVGGSVSVASLPFFQAFPVGHLDRYETRKLVFQCPGALSNPERAFLKAVEFELLWLRNKRDYYGGIHREDDARLTMLEQRYTAAIQAMEASGTGELTASVAAEALAGAKGPGA